MDAVRVAVIGSGPAGLSAALHAVTRGVSHVLLEKSDHLADTIFRYQRGKHVMATPSQLVLRAEQITLAREKNEKVERRQQDHDDLVRLDALEQRIGSTAMMALWPHLHFSRRELWEIHHLHDTE